MTKDKRKTPSGLRSVATLQTLARSTEPQERYQIANRYARLENERARLERELSIWENRLQATAKKLAKVREEIDTVRPLLEEAPAKNAVCRSGRGQRRGPALADAPGSATAPRRTMQLGY
jgi:septal ring factor EnvC (AmiA/AmiB activator)